MRRRVFTYPAGLGWDGRNLVSTRGAFVLALGIAVVAVDMFWPRGGRPYARRNLWNAGTLEWLTEMPGKSWGVRSVPEIDSRYPPWQQEDFLRHVDEGRFFMAVAAAFGGASCRERVGQYVSISVVAVSLKKKK